MQRIGDCDEMGLTVLLETNCGDCGDCVDEDDDDCDDDCDAGVSCNTPFESIENCA